MLETGSEHAPPYAAGAWRPRRPAAASGAATVAHRPRGLAAIPRQRTREYEAFVQLHEAHYLRYATARLRDAVAGQGAVETTLEALAGQWDDLLRAPCPAADAWRQLRTVVSGARRSVRRRHAGVDRLYRTLPDEAADAVLLRYRLRMPPGTAADLMGMDRSAVAALLQSARRRLPAATYEHLQEDAPLP
ncbi:hypothetical protein V1J52_24765 [Streptomyces sp. TRM 70351]|uniref:hypothetical protein n=1 Tax=Streptomyces sp. TRM 70351 TaxID=3116552 RepID=UPI002E7BD482|nr:hypothetical protein [Streptomyces sp. TRM 70351]MEE1931335.1 hypothetical protein [Streptomyces sp. TRM 70351]